MLWMICFRVFVEMNDTRPPAKSSSLRSSMARACFALRRINSLVLYEAPTVRACALREDMVRGGYTDHTKK